MERLRTRSQFQAVLAGHIVARTPHFALHVLDTKSGPAAPGGEQGADMTRQALLAGPVQWRAGALIPKRWAKRAATRNAIRRQIYEAVKEWTPLPGPMAMVVRLRAAFDRASFHSASSSALKQAVRAEVRQLLAGLQLGARREQTA